MGIKTEVYIKLEKTSFSEMINDSSKYTALCEYSIYRDETKTSIICKKEFSIDNLKLEELNLENVYMYLMKEFNNPKFI